VSRHLLEAPPPILLFNSYSASLPFLVAGTRRVAIMPERLAQKLAGAAGIRILLGPELPAIRRVVQWHPRRDSDPVSRWVRDHLAAVAAESLGCSEDGRLVASSASRSAAGSPSSRLRRRDPTIRP
jgi:DNA-binding transcriptional LysR family regulator